MSPGGETQSGAKLVESVMVVTDENNADGGHARPVDAAVVASGNRVILGSEGQSSPTVEIDSELTRAIVRQGWGRPAISSVTRNAA